MRAWIRRHPVVSFVVLAYTLSWADWIPLLLGGGIVTPGGRITHFPGLLGPAVAAFAITALAEGSAGTVALLRRMVLVSKPSSHFLAYSLSPLLFLVLALAGALVAGRSIPTVDDFALYSGLPPLSFPLVLLLILLFNGYGEETGWRGFALARLQARFGPVRGTLLLALIWAGWHTPAFWFVEGYQSLGAAALVGGFGLGIVCGTVVLARVLARTNNSVLAAALWHATYNLTSATAAGRGLIGAATTMCVMVWAGILLLMEWRRPLPQSRLAVSRTS